MSKIFLTSTDFENVMDVPEGSTSFCDHKLAGVMTTAAVASDGTKSHPFCLLRRVGMSTTRCTVIVLEVNGFLC